MTNVFETFFATVEHDAEKLWGIVKTDAGVVVKDVEDGAISLWNLAKPIFINVEADVAASLQAFVRGVVTDPAHAGSDLATLEAAVLNAVETAAAPVYRAALALGSNLLQVVIGLVKHDVSKL